MDIVLMILACLIITLEMIQPGKSDGLSGFTGKNDLSLFKQTKSRGSEKVLENITIVVAVAFFVLAVISALV